MNSVYRSNKCSHCNLYGHNLRSCRADGAEIVRKSRETPEQREKKIEKERLRAEKQLEKKRLIAEKKRLAELEKQAAIKREREAAIKTEKQAAMNRLVDFRRQPEVFKKLTEEQRSWTIQKLKKRMEFNIRKHQERLAEVRRMEEDQSDDEAFWALEELEDQRREAFYDSLINIKNEIRNLTAIAEDLMGDKGIFKKLNITVKKNEANLDADSLLEPVECGICYQTYENNQFIGLNCNHEFCKQCILTCLRKENKQRACCAMCRSNINTMTYKGEAF